MNRLRNDFKGRVIPCIRPLKQVSRPGLTAHDQNSTAVLLSHLDGMLKPIRSRHDGVEQNQIGLCLSNSCQSLGQVSPAYCIKFSAITIENQNYRLSDNGLIVYNENGVGGHLAFLGVAIPQLPYVVRAVVDCLGEFRL